MPIRIPALPMGLRPFYVGFLALTLSLLSPRNATALNNIGADQRTTPYSPTSIVTSPFNNFVYALGTGVADPSAGVRTSAILCYAVQSDGTLKVNGKPTTDSASAGYFLAMHPKGTTLYAVLGQRIVVYRVNRVTGALSAIQTVSESVGTPPTSITLDTAGTSLYVMRGVLAVYAVNPSDGTLNTTTDYASSGLSGLSIAITANGKYAAILTAPTGGQTKGRLTVYPRSASGTVGSTAVSTASTSTPTPLMVVSTRGGYLYVGENGNSSAPLDNLNRPVPGVDSITPYGMTDAGSLMRNGPAAADTGYGGMYVATAGPFIAASPKGDFIYAVGFVPDGYNPGYIREFSINLNGTLSPSGFVGGSTGQSSTGGTTPLSAAVSVDGKYVYTANNGNSGPFGHHWREIRSFKTGAPTFVFSDAVVGVDSILLSATVTNIPPGLQVLEFAYRSLNPTQFPPITRLVQAKIIGNKAYAMIPAQPLFYNVPYTVYPVFWTAGGFDYGSAGVFTVTNPMVTTPKMFYSGDSLAFTDTVSVAGSQFSQGDTVSAGFAFFTVGAGDPAGATPVYSIPASIKTSSTGTKSFRAAYLFPLVPYTLSQRYYEVRGYIEVNGIRHYGHQVTADNAPMLKLAPPVNSIWNQVSLNVFWRIDMSTGNLFFTIDSLPRTLAGIKPFRTRSSFVRDQFNWWKNRYKDTLSVTLSDADLVTAKQYYVRLYRVVQGDTLFVDSTRFTYTRRLYSDAATGSSNAPFTLINLKGHVTPDVKPVKLGYALNRVYNGIYDCQFPAVQPTLTNNEFTIPVTIPSDYFGFEFDWRVCATDAAGNVTYGNVGSFDFETPLTMALAPSPAMNTTRNGTTFTIDVYRAKRVVDSKCATTVVCTPDDMFNGITPSCTNGNVPYGAAATVSFTCQYPGAPVYCTLSCTQTVNGGSTTVTGNDLREYPPQLNY